MDTVKADQPRTTEEVQLAFYKLRAEFRAIGIDKPMAFIRWKRPELKSREEDAILRALCGRAVKKDVKHIPTVISVLDELKAA